MTDLSTQFLNERRRYSAPAIGSETGTCSRDLADSFLLSSLLSAASVLLLAVLLTPAETARKLLLLSSAHSPL